MKVPVSIDLAAASWGRYMAKRLVRFGAGRQGQAPTWEGRGEAIAESGAGVPLTDRSWWAGRYVLCELTLEKTDGERLTLADAVASVSRERRIVSTAIVGRDGTVKEYINEGDWAVSLLVGVQSVGPEGIMDDYPEDELKRLKQFLDEKEALRVYSAFLDVFGISRIVIKNVSVAQTTDQNYQAVSIGAVSDEDYEIYSTEY